jgi:asparagine synthase (glutamine-hydrolysing)
MCGIYGEIRYSPGGPVGPVGELTGLMARRGPDDVGAWSDPAGRVDLGFRRLAILDLSPSGGQPMATADGRFVLVYNGELYNYRDLRGELRGQGVTFRSSGDTEVVLQSLARWGVDALGRFNGMFALGFYDSVTRRLLLARDHAGIKPLYYLRSGSGVVFASQYDQIVSHPWARRLDVSPEALGLYLRLGYIPAPYALLDGTAMLQPGAWLEAGADGSFRRGVHFRFPGDAEPDLRGAEADEAVGAAVAAAVRRHLISDVPVGVFLSGGVDSPLVAAEVRRATGAGVHAFTIGVPDDPMDETEDASRYAQELGLDHHVALAPGELGPRLLLEAAAACSEPFADESMAPTLLVSRFARRYVKVVLSGDGGDELFWGYAGRFGSVLRCAAEFGQPRWLRRSRWGLRKHLRLGDGRPELCWGSIGAWYRAKHSRIHETLLHRLFPELPGWPADFPLFDFDGSDPGRAARWLRWNEFTGHLAMVLLKVDRASMYHGLEVRVPLLDREVIDVAARVDWQSCLELGEEGSELGKRPLRNALAKHVTRQTTEKRGFGVPLGRWFRGPLRRTFEADVLSRDGILGQPLDRAAARELFDRHLSGRSDYGRALWMILCLSHWERAHGRGWGRPAPAAASPALG